jgi:hypothetical protein
MLVALLVAGAVALIMGAGAREAPRRSRPPISEVARDAGCRLTEFDREVDHNPPVAGPFSERDRAADGSYVGRRSPSVAATIHVLYHGRVLIQFRPGLPERQIEALRRVVLGGPNANGGFGKTTPKS